MIRRPGQRRPGLLLTLLLSVSVIASCSIVNTNPPSLPTATAPPVPTETVAPAPAAPTLTEAPAATLVPTVAPTSTANPPTPTPSSSALQTTVDQYVQAWQGAKYNDMYGMLSISAKSSITETKFVSR